MTPLTPLQKLRLLDTSSPQFPDRLTSLLYEPWCSDWATNLQGEDPSWLVEYLNTVLGTLHPASPAFRKCLCELRVISGIWKILPQSHVLPASLLNVTEWPIASRGSCDVYEGLLNDSKVCVKRLRIYSAEGSKDAERTFCQEAVVWKRLVHPNIVPLLGATVAPFQLVSAWMVGGELSQYISIHRDVDRLGLLSDIANGLSYLHSHGVIHGDLKGPSILVDDTGHARLTDFGLAIVVSDPGSSAPITDGHAVRWAAPEVMDRERPISKESDIYSFAMVVVEIFTGRAPFHDSTPTTVAVDVLSGNRPERPTHPSLTDDLWDLTERCWNKNPRWRPDISEVVLRLRTTFAPQCGNNTTPVDATLEGVRQRELPSGLHYRPSRPTSVSRKLLRPWKYCKSSHNAEPEYEGHEKSMNMRHEPSDRPKGLPEKQKTVPAGDGGPPASSRAENYYVSFKHLIMQPPFSPSRTGRR